GNLGRSAQGSPYNALRDRTRARRLNFKYVWLVLVRAVLPGVGGSLGFAAFVTVAILVTLNRVAAWPTREMQTCHNRVATDVASTSTQRNPAQTSRSAAHRNHTRPSTASPLGNSSRGSRIRHPNPELLLTSIRLPGLALR